jgi:hypothetical protein
LIKRRLFTPSAATLVEARAQQELQKGDPPLSTEQRENLEAALRRSMEPYGESLESGDTHSPDVRQ